MRQAAARGQVSFSIAIHYAFSIAIHYAAQVVVGQTIALLPRGQRYNRNVKWTVAALAALMLCSCGKRIDTTEAVQATIVRDIGKKVDVNNMSVSVTSVSFRGNEADAVVRFTAKGAGPSSGFSMHYALEKRGGDWAIKSRSMADVSRHAGGASAVGSGQLPPGHPALPDRKP
jgi:hypothetical protein